MVPGRRQISAVSALGGDLPTIVIDATGNADSMARRFDLAVHSGRIVFVGLFVGAIVRNPAAIKAMVEMS